MNGPANEEILEKVEALKSIVMASVTDGAKDNERYQLLRSELLAIHWVKTSLPRFIRTASDLSQVWHEITIRERGPFTPGSGIWRTRRTFITEEFAPLLNHLLERRPETAPDAFFPKGSQHDAYVHIRSIFGKAKKHLFVIDPYMDGSIYQLLATMSAAALTVRILTLKVPADFALERQKFVKQHPAFTVEARTAKDFHDRFILIDKVQCHLMGASIKDAGERGCTLLAITDPDIVKFILAYADGVWDRANAI
jgi:hypothetical protein